MLTTAHLFQQHTDHHLQHSTIAKRDGIMNTATTDNNAVRKELLVDGYERSSALRFTAS